MKISNSRWLAVRFYFPPARGRAEGWGRLVELTADGGQLLTRFDCAPRDEIFIDFELGKDQWRSLECRVGHVDFDLDGYCVAELEFQNLQANRALGRVLTQTLARIAPSTDI